MAVTGNYSWREAPNDSRKRKLLHGLNTKTSTGLEIGALCRPFLSAENGPVIYADHADTETLRNKYANDPTVVTDHIVDVTAVWGSNSLLEATCYRKVDYIVASHVIEHVPDLITWLKELSSVLTRGGEIRLIIPDKRFSFDYLRRETQMTDVLLSYMVRARLPQPHSLIEFALNVVDLNIKRAWRLTGKHEQFNHLYALEDALTLAKSARDHNVYHDIHCWVFSPQSFARLLSDIARAGLTDLACEGFFDTEENDFEFFVTLRRSSDRDAIIASWDRMQSLAIKATPGCPFWRIRRTIKRLQNKHAIANFRRRPFGSIVESDPPEVESPPRDFDPVGYLSLNDDVRRAGVDPVEHYMQYGKSEGRIWK